MQPDEVLKCVYSSRRMVWKDTFPSHKAFVRFLKKAYLDKYPDGEFPELESYVVSRLLGVDQKKAPERVLKVLPVACEAIARRLGRPDLFTSNAESEVLMKIDEVHPNKSRSAFSDSLGSDGLLVPEPIAAGIDKGKVPLHPHEVAVVRSLMKSLSDNSNGNVVSWNYHEPLGASFLAYVVAGTYLRSQGIENAYLVRPFPLLTETYLSGVKDGFEPEHAYEDGLSQLAVRLGVQPNTRHSMRDLLTGLEEGRGVLFVLNAELLEEAGTHTRMHELLRLATRSRRSSRFAPICLVGAAKLKYRSVDIGEELRHAASRRAGAGDDYLTRDRLSFFRAEWRRFCDYRGIVLSDDVGTRMKRARWYYEGIGEQDVWPISIRMRAFLSSNYRVYSYFDPTGGWTRLASWPLAELPPDIRLHLDEVVVHARSLPGDHRQPALRALKWTSTALYWLTGGAVKDLNAGFKKYKSMEAFMPVRPRRCRRAA